MAGLATLPMRTPGLRDMVKAIAGSTVKPVLKRVPAIGDRILAYSIFSALLSISA